MKRYTAAQARARRPLSRAPAAAVILLDTIGFIWLDQAHARGWRVPTSDGPLLDHLFERERFEI